MDVAHVKGDDPKESPELQRIPGGRDGETLPEEVTTDSMATRFVMTPHSKGTIERYTTPDRLPPLVTSSVTSMEGVACTGEPSIDPSRAVQNPLGDSEWLEEFQES
ncbi:MAG: hypothetical protein SGARI_005724 [Bacillariaceae sp.]